MIAPYDPHAPSATVVAGDFFRKFACRSAKRPSPARAAASPKGRRGAGRRCLPEFFPYFLPVVRPLSRTRRRASRPGRWTGPWRGGRC